MAKDAYYFTHDCNASNDPKILQMCSVYGAEGYGWYWMLIEQMRQQEDYKLVISGKYILNAFASRFYTNVERFTQFIEDCLNEFHLFKKQDGFLWSESLMRRMELYKQKSDKARQSALKRWEKPTPNEAEMMPTQSKRIKKTCEGYALKYSKVKYSKVNKSKVKEDILSQADEEIKKFTLSKKGIDSFISILASRNKTGIVGDPRKLSLLCQLSAVLAETGDETIFNNALLEMTGKGIANINYLKQVITSKKKIGVPILIPPQEPQVNSPTV